MHAVRCRLRDACANGRGLAGRDFWGEHSSHYKGRVVSAWFRSSPVELASTPFARSAASRQSVVLGQKRRQLWKRLAPRDQWRLWTGGPGRAASSVLEGFAAKHNGSYRVALSSESEALRPYAAWSGVAASGLGYDLENARTIVSFGTSLLDGWGTPGRFTRAVERKSGRGIGSGVATDPDRSFVVADSGSSLAMGGNS